MEKAAKARVFMSGRSQHVSPSLISIAFARRRFSIRRDPCNGDIILSEGPGPWAQVFSVLDAANVPDEFLSDAERDRRPPARRAALEELLTGPTKARRKRK